MRSEDIEDFVGGSVDFFSLISQTRIKWFQKAMFSIRSWNKNGEKNKSSSKRGTESTVLLQQQMWRSQKLRFIVLLKDTFTRRQMETKVKPSTLQLMADLRHHQSAFREHHRHNFTEPSNMWWSFSCWRAKWHWSQDTTYFNFMWSLQRNLLQVIVEFLTGFKCAANKNR